MGDVYRVNDGVFWGVELEEGFARRLRGVGLSEDLRQELMVGVAVDVGDRFSMNFVGGSLLLQSATYVTGMSHSILMDPVQRDFFLDSFWREGKMPNAFGGNEGFVYYGGHNVDTNFVGSKLVDAWVSWLDRVRRRV